MRTLLENLIGAYTEWAIEEAGDASEGNLYCALVRVGDVEEQKAVYEDDLGMEDYEGGREPAFLDPGFYFVELDNSGFIDFQRMETDALSEAQAMFLDWTEDSFQLVF